MKNVILVLLAVLFGLSGFGQYQEVEAKERQSPEKEKGFKKDNLFVGGTLNVGFGNSFTALGIAPFVGYNLTNWLDVAFSPGVSYTSQRDVVNLDDRLRQTVYGPGSFIRIFPFRFVFAQAQYEFNLSRQKYIPPRNTGLPKEKYKYDAHSFLVGGGYAGGRDEDNKSYFYISVMWDIANAEFSPYKDNLNRAVPIIRAGYNIALFQGRR
jgi:hypothetical protein